MDHSADMAHALKTGIRGTKTDARTAASGPLLVTKHRDPMAVIATTIVRSLRGRRALAVTVVRRAAALRRTSTTGDGGITPGAATDLGERHLLTVNGAVVRTAARTRCLASVSPLSFSIRETPANDAPQMTTPLDVLSPSRDSEQRTGSSGRRRRPRSANSTTEMTCVP